MLLAFASSTLIAALAFELFSQAIEAGGLPRSAAGLVAGLGTLVIVNAWLDARVASGAGVLLVAIFVSNFPESLVGASAMRRGGLSRRTVMAIWTATAVVLTLAVVLGFGALSALSDEVLAVPLAFAGGAVLASLTDTLMPEAFEHGRPLNSFATGAGFLLSFVLSEGLT